MTFPLPIDHGRYLVERRYRREVHFALRRAARRSGLYQLPVIHDPGGRCCQREGWDDTQARIVQALQEDGAVFGLLHMDRMEELVVGLSTAPAAARPGGRLDLVLSTLLLRALNAGACKHVKAGSPLTLVQLHDPRLLCLPCHERAGKKVRGTPEDATCDLCRREAEKLRLIVVNLMPGDLAQLVPQYRFVATGGLCMACYEAEMLVERELEIQP